MSKTADINYYTVRDKAIELGIIKVSDKDGSYSFNASPEKLFKLVEVFSAQSDKELTIKSIV